MAKKKSSKKAKPKKASKSKPKKATPKKTAKTKPKKTPKSKVKKATKAKPVKKAKAAPKPAAPTKPAAPAKPKPQPAFKPTGSVKKQCTDIAARTGDAYVACLLSGGVVSSILTLLGYKALGKQLKVFIVDNGLLRQNESKDTFLLFSKLGMDIQIVNARKEFASALSGKHDPDQKRQAVIKALYYDTLNTIIRQSKAKYLLHSAYAGNGGQLGKNELNNLYNQLDINPETPFGCTFLEPFAGLKKEVILKMGKELKIPSVVVKRKSISLFGLAGRVVGEATSEKIEIVRRATTVIESVLGSVKASHILPVIHEGRIPAVINKTRTVGFTIEIRCWEDAKGKACNPLKLSPKATDTLVKKLLTTVPGVVGVSYNVTPSPPAVPETL